MSGVKVIHQEDGITIVQIKRNYRPKYDADHGYEFRQKARELVKDERVKGGVDDINYKVSFAILCRNESDINNAVTDNNIPAEIKDIVLLHLREVDDRESVFFLGIEIIYYGSFTQGLFL